MSAPQITTDMAATRSHDSPRGIGQPPADGGESTVAQADDMPVVEAGRTGRSADADDFRRMLRLKAAAVMTLAVIIWGTALLFGITGAEPIFARDVIGDGGVALIAAVVAAWAVGATALWLHRGWTLQPLRAAEFAILAPHAGLLVVTRLLQFSAADHRGGDYMLAVAARNGFGWLAALVAWGLVFPHPRWRMLAINVSLCALPAASDLVLILADPGRWSGYLTPAIVTAQMLLFGFVVSLFGSHRITALQEEVAEARQKVREARRLGPYTLKRRLGAGGMGEVYLAEHHLLKRPCAVKLIRPERAGDRATLARFEREAQATALLKHPNTVAVLDYGRTDDGIFYYVMELLDGLDLAEVVRRHGPLPPGRSVRVLAQLCGALREAHDAGLVHRDIKPSNVLLCRHGGLFDVVKLVDFGLVAGGGSAGPGEPVTQVGSIVGTPEYISPEQADGTEADERSDLYSLGATAYFLLSGRPPFPDGSMLDILIAHRTQPAPSVRVEIAEVPAHLDALIGRLMAKRPADRPPTAAAVLADLAGCGGCTEWTDADAEQWWRTVGAVNGESPDDCGRPNQILHPSRPEGSIVGDS